MSFERNLQLAQPAFLQPSNPTVRQGAWRGLKWLPLPLLLVAVLVLWSTDLQGSYESSTLVMGLNFITRTLASMWIMVLMGRRFLARGEPGILLLGCGVAIWGGSGIIGSPSLNADVNFGVAIGNVGLWLSALCHLAGVILSAPAKREIRKRVLWLGTGYTVALGVVGLITLARAAGWLPVFFVDGQGGTLVRYLMLGSALAMFVLAAALLRESNRRLGSAFVQWYALALLLLGVGVLGMILQSTRTSWLNWACRISQSLGGVYLFMAALAAVRESGVAVLAPESGRTAPRTMPYRYIVALTIAMAAAALRLGFLQGLGTSSLFITFYPAVMLAALYGGFGPGILAALASALMADYFWTVPAGRLFLNSPVEWLAITVFLVSCAMISVITEAMRRAQARVYEAETQAQIVAARQRDLEALRESEERLRFALETSHTGAWDYDLENPTTQRSLEHDRIFGYEELQPQWTYAVFLEHVLPEDRAAADAKFRAAIDSGSVLRFECRIRRADGQVRWIWAAGRHRADAKGARRIAGIIQDITQRKAAEELLRQANDALERRVAERTGQLATANADLRAQMEAYERLEGEVARLVEAERLHLGMELHDNLCQQIAATGMLASSLAKRLRSSDSPLVDMAGRMVTTLSQAGEDIHQMARGLLPVQIEPDGLMMALADLVQRTQELLGVACSFQCTAPVPVENTTVATYLFRIAQESIHNAVKHGRARHIVVSLSAQPGVTLMIRDDGVGIAPAPARAAAGSGLRIMAHRARVIGAEFSVTPADGGGTLVKCTLPQGAGPS